MDGFDRESRRKPFSEPEFNTSITTEEALAMKATLSLLWKKLRIMRRYIIHDCIYMLYIIGHSAPYTSRWFEAQGKAAETAL